MTERRLAAMRDVFRGVRVPALLLCAALFASGCFDNVATVFPEGLEPFEEVNEAPLPMGEEPYPEHLTFVRKRCCHGALNVHAKAYVQADVATTFAAVRNPLAGADRREAVTFTYEEDIDPEYRWSHRSHLVIPDIVTVEFDLTWRSDIVEGTVEEPTITATRWQKTFGTTAIARLEGSIVCREVEPGVTVLEIQYHLDALSSSYETIEDYLQGYYDSILALVRGEPLPIQE